MTLPSLPENLGDLNQTEQSRQKELYRRRLVHYNYVKALHHAALMDPTDVLRRRFFCHASDPWEGETLVLRLIEATQHWEALTGGGVLCPVVFDAEDARKTMTLDEVQSGADRVLEVCQNIIGVGPVSTKLYEVSMARSKQLKEDALAVRSGPRLWHTGR